MVPLRLKKAQVNLLHLEKSLTFKKYLMNTMKSLNLVNLMIYSLSSKKKLKATWKASKSILKSANAAVIELCTNAEFRRSITKIARPVNELNQKVIIKVNENSYEINCENQYKFLTEDEEEILPELQNGETVSLIGMLTRMNMRNNDLGFEYHGKTLSISPVDPDKNVATEYHQFTPLPQVQVMGIVARDNAFVVPRLKVIKMSVPENIQPELFKDNKKELASNSAQNIK